MEPRLGVGVDRSQLRELLKLTPEQRIKNAAAAARGVNAFRAAQDMVVDFREAADVP